MMAYQSDSEVRAAFSDKGHLPISLPIRSRWMSFVLVGGQRKGKKFLKGKQRSR